MTLTAMTISKECLYTLTGDWYFCTIFTLEELKETKQRQTSAGDALRFLLAADIVLQPCQLQAPLQKPLCLTLPRSAV